MHNYLLLSVLVLKFWYFEAPKDMFAFFLSLNKAFFELFSLPLFLRTFFQPLKNEYRQGLVGFSRAMGMGVKSVLIVVDLLLFALLLVFEVGFVVSFLVFPVLTIAVLFYG